MDYIRKHKLTSFVILVYIIIVGFAYFIYKLFIGSSGLPVYGDRLDGIENVPITEEQKKQIVEKISENSNVLKVTTPYLKGKILKIVVTVDDKAALKSSKEMANSFLDVLDDDQRAFYDIEFFINKGYHCTLEATGKMDEDGNFTSDVTVKFLTDLSKDELVTDYGISKEDKVDYNKEQTYSIKDDGEYVIYGFAKDKISETKCSIKIVKKTSEEVSEDATINTISIDRDFPTIGYMKAGTKSFVWSKTT